MSRRGRDEGSATLWVVCAMAVVVAVGGACAAVGTVTVDRHRADAAADAAALAAAADVLAGQSGACAAGAVIAKADGATLTRCGLAGAAAQVEVTVALPGLLGRFGVAVGRARAGPALRSAGYQVDRGVGPADPDDRRQQPQRSGLVERLIPVAALGRMDT
jgi:secretion/DNA translocation related TadE-like protein